MNKETQAAYDNAQSAIGDAATTLSRGDYLEYLEELKAHIQCLIDCWNEEEETKT